MVSFVAEASYSLSWASKREAARSAYKGKPGVNHRTSKTKVTNKRLKEEVSEAALLKKPDGEDEKPESKPVDLTNVDVDPATKALLSLLPKDDEDKIVVQSDANGEITRVITVRKNDTFIAMFRKLGYSKKEIDIIAFNLKKDIGFETNRLKIGQKFVLKEKISNGQKKFISLQIPSDTEVIKVEKDSEGKVQAKTDKKKTDSQYVYKSGKIKTTIVGLASVLGLPSSITSSVVKVLSSRNSLSSDTRKDDVLEVLYEQVKNEQGKVIDNNALYISLKGKIINVEAFTYSSTGENDKANFYDSEGRGFKKSILRNPLKARYRISSGFGYRKHPVLKRRILHAGTDFAAPSGTPIYAGADGTISKIGRFGGYGNYIKIRHDSKWETSYGHMKKFAKGMRKYKRVKQGELIGYVGTTGRSTGNHLHYEVIRYGKPVNAQKVDLPIGIQLNRESVKKLKARIAELRGIIKNTQ